MEFLNRQFKLEENGTTVRREVRAIRPVASSTNSPNVDERRNTGRSVSNSSRHEAGRVSSGSIGGTLRISSVA